LSQGPALFLVLNSADAKEKGEKLATEKVEKSAAILKRDQGEEEGERVARAGHSGRVGNKTEGTSTDVRENGASRHTLIV